MLNNFGWLIIWMFIGGALFLTYPVKQKEIVLGKQEERWRIAPAILLSCPYLIWAGMRSDIWGDTHYYRKMFLAAPSKISEWATYMEGVSKDKGFSYLMLIIKAIVGNYDELFFLVLAAIQLGCLIYVYRKYSCNYWLSIYVFVASTDYMSWMHNGIRQFTAVTIAFVASTLMLKKKYIPMILLILIASTIHGSALLMLPIIYIIQGQAWNKKTLLFTVASVVALVFVDQFTNVLDTILSDTQYTNIVSDWKSWDDDGTNPIRVLVYSIPTILSLLGLKWIRHENNPMINMAVNSSIVSTALYLVSMGTSGIFIGRLPIYVSLYATGILLPWEIENIFTKDSARIVKIILIALYGVFFYYQMHFGWALL